MGYYERKLYLLGGNVMLKEKYENAKRFVKDHKGEIIAYGCLFVGAAATGTILGKKDGRILKMEKDIERLKTLSEFTLDCVDGLNKDVEALAHHNGLTMGDVWDIAFELKRQKLNIKK